MDKLDEKNADAFGQAVSGIVKSMPDTEYLSIGILIENIYLRFQKEAERDARDVANGKREQ